MDFSDDFFDELDLVISKAQESVELEHNIAVLCTKKDIDKLESNANDVHLNLDSIILKFANSIDITKYREQNWEAHLLVIKNKIDDQPHNYYQHRRAFLLLNFIINKHCNSLTPSLRGFKTLPRWDLETGYNEWQQSYSNDRQFIDLHWLICSDFKSSLAVIEDKYDAILLEDTGYEELLHDFVHNVGNFAEKLRVMVVPETAQYFLSTLVSTLVKKKQKKIKELCRVFKSAMMQLTQVDKRMRLTEQRVDEHCQVFHALLLSSPVINKASPKAAWELLRYLGLGSAFNIEQVKSDKKAILTNIEKINSRGLAKLSILP
jgi:hypothetical protein